MHFRQARMTSGQIITHLSPLFAVAVASFQEAALSKARAYFLGIGAHDRTTMKVIDTRIVLPASATRIACLSKPIAALYGSKPFITASTLTM